MVSLICDVRQEVVDEPFVGELKVVKRSGEKMEFAHRVQLLETQKVLEGRGREGEKEGEGRKGRKERCRKRLTEESKKQR